MSLFNYPKPSQSKKLLDALRQMRELMPVAKQRVNALPTEEMLNSLTGEKEIVKIATAEMLQRIIVDVFKLKLIVDTQLLDSGDTPTVVATALILTADGYQVLRSSTASEQRGAGNFSPVLSAESRAIRLVLRSIGLRTEGALFDVENADQLNDAIAGGAPEKEKKSEKNNSDKDKNDKHNSRIADKHKEKRQATAVDETHVGNVFFGITLDKTAVDYVDKLRQVLRSAKAEKPRGTSIADFIQSVLGPRSAKRLEGCTTSELEKLLEHYVENADSTI